MHVQQGDSQTEHQLTCACEGWPAAASPAARGSAGCLAARSRHTQGTAGQQNHSAGVLGAGGERRLSTVQTIVIPVVILKRTLVCACRGTRVCSIANSFTDNGKCCVYISSAATPLCPIPNLKSSSGLSTQ